jgi:hypothetical protein
MKREVCEWPDDLCYERPTAPQAKGGAPLCALHATLWASRMQRLCEDATVIGAAVGQTFQTPPITLQGGPTDMARQRNNQMTIPELQAVATKFVQHHISNNSFGLATLDEEQFKTAMDAIVKAMMSAWQDGYLTGRGK